jgi:NitT/TauT family transport system substrate-binding protein
VQYVKVESTLAKGKALITGQADITSYFAAPFITWVDAGEPVIALAGVHVGCFELFATERIRAIRDLKGKTIAVHVTMSAEHIFIASILAHVGMNPDRDVRWATYPVSESMQLLAEGKIDAFLCFPPVSQELRARKIGHVLVNSSIDRPWAQYFCCITVGNREFVRKHPVATKRAVRALLKATDLCAREPERAARLITDRGFVERYDYALQTMREVPYDRWRQQDPADTIRFYALRLREGGMIKASPQKILAQGSDWRFLNELKKELKG